jgi:hypothetical protein
MNDNTPPLFDRYTLLFDFLGSSRATAWPKDRLYPFLDLLIAIAGQVQSTQDIDGSRQKDGSYRVTITPEVTAFSDNIVVSYPTPEDDGAFLGVPARHALRTLWAKFMCQDAIRILSGVAEMGLRIGVLIRGGFTLGQLHHDNGVVFGAGMVEAHRLESVEAIVPRVLVSDRILKELEGIPPAERGFLLQDTDGRWHLDYFTGMIRHSTNSEITKEQVQRWTQAHRATIGNAIARAADDARIADKWRWFERRFEAAKQYAEGEPY